ncbi:MAG TPA: 30S ribosomal protein S9 [Candidatus Paceibacterota bacterium]
MNTLNKTNENRYIEAVGRRKTSIARVRITPSTKTSYEINNRTMDDYFPTNELRKTVEESLATSKLTTIKFQVTVRLSGGGISSQADALKLGIARALIEYDRELRGKMKKAGLLKRDPRAKERRKFGLKKARKSPQWSKR